MSDIKSLPVVSVLRRLKSRQLLLLAAIDEHRTLRKAAAAMNTTQPAATKLVRDLEDTMGHALFERHRRGLLPTAFGEVMIRHAKTVITEFDRTCQDLDSLAAGGTGRVRIGVVPSAVPFFVSRSIARLKRKQPRLDVFVEVSTSDTLLRHLGTGELDILVARRWQTPEGSDFAYEGSIDETLVVAARTGHPVALSPVIPSLGELLGWPWILLPEASPMRQVLAPLFREHGLSRPENLVETASMLMIIALLQETDSLAVIPEDVLRSGACRDFLTRIPVELPAVMGAYGILTRRDRPLSAATQAYLDILRDVIRESRVAAIG